MEVRGQCEKHGENVLMIHTNILLNERKCQYCRQEEESTEQQSYQTRSDMVK